MFDWRRSTSFGHAHRRQFDVAQDEPRLHVPGTGRLQAGLFAGELGAGHGTGRRGGHEQSQDEYVHGWLSRIG